MGAWDKELFGWGALNKDDIRIVLNLTWCKDPKSKK